MTSTRGQNVSILQLHCSTEPWDPPITSFTDSGGSLRSAPRFNSLRSEKGSFLNGEKLKQHSLENSLSGTLKKYPKRDFNSNKSISVVITNSINSSPGLNSTGRELSPVRWCDREVDGVYLGKSGWVQVQQRSLDENRRVGGDNGGVSTLPNRVKLSNLHSNSENDERKERQRPVYLPLPKEKHTNHKMPSSLVREIESVSPPSITPIISPPPAFKDPGLELEFQAYTSRANSSGKSPFLPRSKAIVDCESPPKSPPNEWDSLEHQFRKLSPLSSLQQLPHILQTKSLEEDATMRREFRYPDPASPYTFFGFRSLDGTIDRQSSSLRTHKTDTFNEREEDYRDYIKISNSSLDRLNRERISPNVVRQRHMRNGRRTPSSDYSKHSKRSSSLESSSSSSSSSCGRKSPNTSFRRSNSKQNRQQPDNSFSWENRNSKVRRSRSLQLSEKRSPNGQIVITPGESWGPGEYLQDVNKHNQQYAQSPQTDHRIMVTINGDSFEKPRWHSQKMPHSDENKREEVLREAAEEARIISDFLNGTRSRAAARNLLMHRYLNRPENDETPSKGRETPSEPEYGVHFLGTNRRFRKKLQQQNEINYSNGNSCTSNCEFWPHCVNREAPSKPFPSPVSSNSSRNGAIKSSQSYPSQRKDREGKGGSARSSPASLESMSDFDLKKKPQRSDVRSSSSTLSQGCPDRYSGNHELKSKKLYKQNSEKIRNKTSENAGVGSYRSKAKQTGSLERDRKPIVSPYEESSSVSSSLSDISGTKSLKPQKTSDASIVNGGVKMSPEVYLSRPGSAPANEDWNAMEADQKSLSLPKSFLSNRYGLKQSNSLQWKEPFIEVPPSNQETGEWGLPLEVPKTAPATPVRELGNAKERETKKKTQCTRSSSTPLLEEPIVPELEWASGTTTKRSEPFTGIVRNNSVPHKKIPSGRIPVGPSESVLQKFKKSFSLKFSKGKGKYDTEDVKNLTEGASEEELPVDASQLKSNGQLAKEDDVYEDQRFRFSSLGWSNKERRKAKKELRNARKVGVLRESRGNLDSSESHDTDHQEECSPVMRRRVGHGTEKSNRPHSEVLNQILSDKFKADLQWRTQTRRYIDGRRIRRTNSDLGDQRLLNRNVRNHHRGLVSTSSLNRHPRIGSRQPSPDGSLISKSNKNCPKTQLRRSMSQPLGLNELFSLMSRRPSAMKSHTFSEDEQFPRVGQSEDELISDSDSSIASLTNRKKNSELPVEEKIVILAEAVWDNVAMEPYELPFRAGDVIEVLDTCDQDWWWGATNEKYGYFPSAFVRLRVSQEDTVEDCLAAMAAGKNTATQLRRGASISLLSNDQVRSSVVRELLNTERDFVKILGDVTEGYLFECRRRSDMFSPALVKAIFSNWEDILVFQTKFLTDLEGRVDREFPYKSCIGETFLQHSSSFRVYSEYCNSHPMAIATLQELYQRNNYCKFFEACRLMRNLIEIPLDGYLLTPVQRICKYPLQLAELLKYTKPDHPDYERVSKALKAMKGVATLINERKRKMESLEKLASWQQRVEGWEGEDLIDMSSQLIYQGEVIRITSGMWTSNITLFLFDHQIVYCKKDLLKRNTFVYKGRLCLDTSEVIDLPDGKDQQLGVTIKHGLKIYSCLADKWLLFCCRSSEDKAKWLNALAEEKKIVIQDREGGLVLPPPARQLAKMSARSKRSPPSKPRSKNYKIEPQFNKVDARTNRSDACGLKIGRRVGTWFAFGGGMKGRRVNLRSRSSPEHVT